VCEVYFDIFCKNSMGSVIKKQVLDGQVNFSNVEWCEKYGKKVKFQAKILKFVEFLSP